VFARNNNYKCARSINQGKPSPETPDPFDGTPLFFNPVFQMNWRLLGTNYNSGRIALESCCSFNTRLLAMTAGVWGVGVEWLKVPSPWRAMVAPKVLL